MTEWQRGGRIPEGAVIASVISVGTAKCMPWDGSECDSWKTFGLGMIRYMNTGEMFPITQPLCKKHFHEYIDNVLFSNEIHWGNADTGDDDD